MEITIDNKEFLVNLTKVDEVDELHEFGEIYHCDIKNSGKITGTMDFYFEYYEFTLYLKKFKFQDFNTAKALLLVLRFFCFNNQSVLIDSMSLTEETGKFDFEKFIDSLAETDDQLNVDNSSQDGYCVYLLDDEDSFNNIKASFIEKEYGNGDLTFNIKELL